MRASVAAAHFGKLSFSIGNTKVVKPSCVASFFPPSVLPPRFANRSPDFLDSGEGKLSIGEKRWPESGKSGEQEMEKEESDSHHIAGARQPTSPASPASQPASQSAQPKQPATVPEAALTYVFLNEKRQLPQQKRQHGSHASRNVSFPLKQ